MKTKAEAITRIITRKNYLIALGLFQMASESSKRATEYQKELNLVIGLDEDDYGHVSDAIWGGGTLDEALKREHIIVEKKK